MTDIPALIERVRQFQAMELPGQPMGMHMGTSYLVNDLAAALQAQARESERLKAEERNDAETVARYAARIRELEAERDTGLPTAMDVRGILKPSAETE